MMPENYPIPSKQAFEGMLSSPILQGMHTFRVNDNNMVISVSDKEWHACLLDIRDEEDKNIIWLQVQWFHNKEDMKDQKFGHHMGEHELVLSENMDLVEARCLESGLLVDKEPGKERIVKFDERSACGPAIEPMDNYMQWCMHVNEMKRIRAGRTKKRKVVYELQASHRQTWTHNSSVEGVGAGTTSNVWRCYHLTCQAFQNSAHGIIGNGKDILSTWEIFATMTEGAGEAPLIWRDDLHTDTLEQAHKYHYYYYCITIEECGPEVEWERRVTSHTLMGTLVANDIELNLWQVVLMLGKIDLHTLASNV
ncbi:hypothetical protein BS17DRAFT_769879 [Gyrodon lividus]|nr:hypothetical protein BS17DRAFT_769879 [Gyrodon lividus]